MNKEYSSMSQKEMMIQMFDYQKESIANGARLQAQMDEVIKRLDTREKTFEKIRPAC